MNVSFNPVDELNATLKITVSPADYQPAVEKELKRYQQRANIPGFRAGKAPLGMVKRMAGKSILVDEINRIASQQLFGYLQENKIDILAQPLMSDTEQSDLDFEKEGDFAFVFDVALAPKFELNITDKDKITGYDIQVTDAMIDEEIENIKRRNGNLNPTEVAGLKDVIYGDVTELNEDKTPLDGGIQGRTISLTPELVTKEHLQQQLVGLKTGDVITVNISDLFNGNENVLAHTLAIAKEGVKDLNPDFELKVTSVHSFTQAELNQELFDKMFGPGIVTDEAAFREKIVENLKAYYQQESEQFVEHELNHLITDKHTFALPDAFLKRWLMQSKPEEYNAENIEERYTNERNYLRFSLVQEKIIEKYGLEISEADMENASLGYTANLFRQYGINNPDYDTLKSFSDKSLKEDKYRTTVKDVAMRKKVIDQLKQVATIELNPVTVEEFYDIIREHNKMHNHTHEHEHADAE